MPIGYIFRMLLAVDTEISGTLKAGIGSLKAAAPVRSQLPPRYGLSIT